jgi:tetratricopeptide (TPR) repeat protein
LLNKIHPYQLFLVLLLLAICISTAQAQTPQDTLNQYVAELKKNPGDAVLREKIIKFVQTMKPKPVMPEDAERYMARGAAAAKGATAGQDFRDAAAEFQKASLAAPWLPAAYYNLGVTQDKAGQYEEAIQNLKLYIIAAPDASDLKAVKNMIYEIEYRQEKAAKESSPEAVAAKKQEDYEKWLKNIDGAKYTGTSNLRGDIYWDNEFIIRGTTLIWRQRITSAAPDVILDIPIGQWYDLAQMQIVERKAKRLLEGIDIVTNIFTISEDGNTLTDQETSAGGKTWTFYRQ